MLNKFIKYYKPHMKLMLWDFFCASMLALLGLAFPKAVANILDMAIPNKDLNMLLLWGAVLLVLYGLQYGLQFFVEYWGHVMGIRIEYDMRRDLFAHVHKLPFTYFDNTKTGQIMSRIVNDLNEISELAHHGPEDLFISAFMLLGTFILMMTMHWQLTLILLVLVPFLFFFALYWNKKMSRGWRELREQLGEINSQVEDSVSGVRVAKSFTNETFEKERFAEGNVLFTKAKQGAYYIMANFSTGIELFSRMFKLITLIVGGYYAYMGQITIGELTAFLLFVDLFLQPLRKLTTLVESYQRGMASFGRFVEIMSIKPEITDKTGAIILERAKGDIAFHNVTFGYNENRHVLKGISFDIPKGKTIALVGPSGGGKTTLVNLIPRFYEVTDGNITIDGINIRDLTQQSLRKNIGIVQQDVFLFSGSVKDNILYGRPDATETDVIAAAKRANAHDFIMALPKGYDTNVGQRGVKLSGGQKQRIAIARIFLKNPPILLLDEATSALDNETERIIQESLFELSANRTTIVIAHRLATIRNADRILVMTDDGIVEQGNHKELLTRPDGIYAKLYNAQFDMLRQDKYEDIS